MSKPIFIILLGCFFVGCSAVVKSPGICKLDCSGAMPAAAGSTIHFLGFGAAEKLTLACQKKPGTNYYARVPIQFMIEKPATPLPAEQIPGDAEHLPTSDVGDTRDTTTALAGISFDISVLGGSMATIPNSSSADDRYKGIVTDKKTWCTNSCGIGFVEIIPFCEADVNDISLLVQSGSAAAAKFNITVNP